MELTANKPIIFLLVDGFGISTAWKGNAVLSANPATFFELYKSYSHKLLTSPERTEQDPSYDNPDLFLKEIFSGKKELSNRQLIEEEIRTGKFRANGGLKKIINQVGESNSALHLCGNISGNGHGKYSELTHLLELVKIAKESELFRVYIHLIVDGSDSNNFDSLSTSIKFLESELVRIGTGEIASIVGMDFLKDSENKLAIANFIKGYRAIVEGVGNQFLSADQIIGQFKNKLVSPSAILPSVIIANGKALTKINDLDSIIFFNHKNSPITKFITSLQSGISQFRLTKSPKYLNITTLFPFALPNNPSFNTLYSTENYYGIPQILSKNNLKQLYVSDSNKLLTIKQLLIAKENINTAEEIFIPVMDNSRYKKEPAFFIDEIFSNIKKGIGKKYDFIFAEVPNVDFCANFGTFDQTIKAVKALDKALSFLIETIEKSQATLIFGSNFGNAEKMVNRSEYERINQRSNNPVPIIIVNDYYKTNENRSIENILLYDIIQRKNSILDIAPTLLSLLGLPADISMQGKSLV